MAAMELQPVSAESQAVFDGLNLGQFENLALVSTAIDGIPCDAVAVLLYDEDGDVDIHPVALIINDALFDKLTPPDTGLDEESA